MFPSYDFLSLEVLGLTTFGLGFTLSWGKGVFKGQADRAADKLLLSLAPEALVAECPLAWRQGGKGRWRHQGQGRWLGLRPASPAIS